MMTAISYRTPAAAFELLPLLRTLLLCVLLVAALPVTVLLFNAVWPLVLLALPAVGKLLVGGALVYAYAFVFKPKGA
jgi:hypothetical protein